MKGILTVEVILVDGDDSPKIGDTGSCVCRLKIFACSSACNLV